MLLDAVFYADSEYHMHFTLKLIFIDHSMEIPAHFLTFLLWFEYFHYLTMFFIFFLIFEAIFRTSVKNCIDLYIPLIGSRFCYPIILGQKGPKTCFLLVLLGFDPKTIQESALNCFFYMLLIEKANWHTTACILDFIMLLLDSLTSVTGNSLLLAFCSNIGLTRWKLHAFRILTRNSESASNSASKDVWIKRFWKKTFFDGPGVPYRCKTTGKKWKSFFDRKKYLILLRI
jgi:hypothetical protein